MEERLLKIMGRAGVGSRRTCDDLIQQGRVTVNGTVAEVGTRANPDVDEIRVDGKLLESAEPMRYVVLYKPPGVLSSPDTSGENRRWVRDLVPLPGHLYPVGRLDVDSEGLILLTNDGGLTHKLTHPRYEHWKTYHVLVEGQPEDQFLEKWRRGGLKLDGQWVAPAKIAVLGKEEGNTWLRVLMREGRKRQIRRMVEQMGCSVLTLRRTHIANLALGDLEPGEWRVLSREEVRDLKREVEEKEQNLDEQQAR